jgi:hypothetical protein
MIGTSFAMVTTMIAGSKLFRDDVPLPTRFTYTAAGVALFVYLIGFICSFFLPEPSQRDIDEEHPA